MKTKLLGELWHECARSGQTFPESLMRLDKDGEWIALRYWDPEDDPNWEDPQDDRSWNGR